MAGSQGACLQAAKGGRRHRLPSFYFDFNFKIKRQEGLHTQNPKQTSLKHEHRLAVTTELQSKT